MAEARPVAGSRSQVLVLVVTLVMPKYGSVASPVVYRPVLAPQPMLSGMVATRKKLVRPELLAEVASILEESVWSISSQAFGTAYNTSALRYSIV